MNDEAYIDAASKALGLRIAAEYRRGVLTYFGLAASMAELVNGLPLTPADESAVVFHPVEPEDGE